MADAKSPTIDEFVTKQSVPKEHRPLLEAFTAFLQERGQYVAPGDLKAQFIEKIALQDKKKVPIEMMRCMVCGHAEYEVKGDV